MNDNAPEASDWTHAVVADSEAALGELCALVDEALADPNPLAAPSPGGSRPLVAVPASDPTAQPNVAVIKGMKALLTAVVGAAAIADDRTKEIAATRPRELRRGRGVDAPDRGVLTHLGEAALERYRRSDGSAD